MSDPGAPPRRFFVSDTGSTRRPVDVTIAAVGALIVLVSALAVAEGGGALDEAVRRVAIRLPDWVTGLFDVAYLLGLLYAVAAIVLAILTARRRRRLLLTVALAVAAAVAGVVLVSFLVGAGWPDLAPGPVRSSTPDTFPTVRVAATAAALLALRPWLVLAYRRLSVAIVAVQCLAAWIIGTGGPTDVIGALGVGMVAAGLALVLIGSPAGHPDLDQVRRSLAELGLDLSPDGDDLAFTDPQPWGVRTLVGTTRDHGPVLVKVYGRDATDAHSAARWWRTLAYRDQAAPDATRLQLVEHEALATLLAQRAGVRVPEVLAAADTDGDAVLVLTAAPAPLVGSDDLDDQLLRTMWESVGRLHGAGLVHTRLTLQNIGVEDGQVVVADFSDARIAAGPADRHREVATLLTAQAVVVGAERATDAALATVGPDVVAQALPFLQRAALPRDLRGEPAVKTALADLPAVIIDRTGVAPPEPAPIVRFKWRDLLQTVLILVAAYALLTTLAGLDWPTVLDTWRHASWVLVVIGLAVAQATSVADAVSTMSAVQSRLPLWPLAQLQYAIKTVGLAISATAGRLALTTAFLRRYGEGPAVAAVATGLDAFSASLCNALVVVLGFVLASDQPNVELGAGDGIAGFLEVLLLAIAVSVLVVGLVPVVRRAVLTAVRSAWESLRGVAANPARSLLMVGSNLASLLITGAALAFICAGLGEDVGYGQAVWVVGAAALFSALVPVPGNVGVAEAALAAGLVAIGVPSGPAFAIAVTQRLATSYLPDIYGAYALRWLRSRDYIS